MTRQAIKLTKQQDVEFTFDHKNGCIEWVIWHLNQQDTIPQFQVHYHGRQQQR